MSATSAITRVVVIAGFKAEITVPRIGPGHVGSVVVEWSPRVPRMDRDFTAADRRRYTEAVMETVDDAL